MCSTIQLKEGRTWSCVEVHLGGWSHSEHGCLPAAGPEIQALRPGAASPNRSTSVSSQAAGPLASPQVHQQHAQGRTRFLLLLHTPVLKQQSQPLGSNV